MQLVTNIKSLHERKKEFRHLPNSNRHPRGGETDALTVEPSRAGVARPEIACLFASQPIARLLAWRERERKLQTSSKTTRLLTIPTTKLEIEISHRYWGEQKRVLNTACAYGHTTLKIPVLVRSPKSSNVGPG